MCFTGEPTVPSKLLRRPSSSSTDTTFSPVVGDFNGDGASDLTGLGGPKNPEAFVSRPTGLVDLVTGDLNGDGDADVVSVSQDFSRVKILLKKTDRTFRVNMLTDTLPVDVQLVQADSDGLLDIITANKVGTSSLFTARRRTALRQDIDLPVVPDKVSRRLER
ncbi:MAG: VCBS repeat-containing protein [Pirellulales bacterium]